MVILNTQTLILTHTLSLLTLSFILLTQPAKIASLSLVWLLGEAMHIRSSPSSTSPSSILQKSRGNLGAGGFDSVTDPIAALALVLAVMGIAEGIWAGGLESGSQDLDFDGSDAKARGARMVTAPRKAGAVGEALAVRLAMLGQWSVLATVKSLGFGAWVVYAYLSSMGRLEREANGQEEVRRAGIGGGVDALNNRLVFAAAFVEMMFWGFVWRGIKKERGELLARVVKAREGREREEDR